MEPPASMGTRLGPYRLLERLGTGAMGSVYRAEGDEGLVALKLIHSHLLDRAGFFKRFQREAESGRRVNHENVVRTFDSDLLVVDGQPCFFLVMEYVRGRTLRELLRERGALPETLVREIGRQVAAGLTAIHDVGIVHRDLKPENVLVSERHRVRIMDLGVARVEGASTRLTQSGDFAGSLRYAAPEQFTSEPVGPATDLYALGVLLYELLAGRCPFRGEGPGAVMQAHLHETPPALEDVVANVSPLMCALATSLLEKSPATRPPSAQAVRTLLTDGERSAWWRRRQSETQPRFSGLPRIAVGRELPFTGRRAELTQLMRALDGVAGGAGRVVWLEGEAGIGKSRLVYAFLREASSVGACLLYGTFSPSGGRRAILDSVLDRLGPARLETRLEPYFEETPRVASRLADALLRRPSRDDAPRLEGGALHAACVRLMRGLASNGPVVWVIEDLHFAEALAVQESLALARGVEGHPVLLLLTARPAGIKGKRAAFERLDSYERLAVGRLDVDAVCRLVEHAYRNPALADALGQRIASVSDGVPFFALELIRSLNDRGFVAEGADGVFEATTTIDAIEAPDSLAGLIRARLAALSREERAAVELGAVLGFTFDPDLLARVLECPSVSALDALAEIERRHGIVRAEGALCHFDHHLVRDVILSDVSEALQREYHSLVADAFAAREGLANAAVEDATPEACFFMASHRLAGRNPAEALAWVEPVLRHSPVSARSERTLRFVEEVLSSPGVVSGTQRARLLLTAGSRLDLMGRSADAVKRAEEALALADESEAWGLRSAASRLLGWALSHQGRAEEAEVRLRDSVALARSAGNAAEELDAEGLLGAFLLVTGRDEEAVPHIERQLVLGRSQGDHGAVCKAAGNLGLVLLDQGRADEARARMLEARDLFHEDGDLLGAARAIGNLGLVASARGESAEAVARYEEQLRLAREIGDRRCEANARLNLSAEFLARGEYEPAGEHVAYLFALSRDLGDPYLESSARWNMGELAWARGRLADAREDFEASLAMSSAFGSRDGEAELRVNLGRLAATVGDVATAVVELEAARDLSREIEDLRIESLAWVGLAQVAGIEGRSAEAVERAQHAVACLDESEHQKARIEPLLELGTQAVSAGDSDLATTALTATIELARACGAPGPEVVAYALLAVVTGDVAQVERAFAGSASRMSLMERLTVHALVWRAVGDETHLASARTLLQQLCAGVPEDTRRSMLVDIPLFRDLVGATGLKV